MADIFSRLNQRPPEEAAKQQRRNLNSIARGAQEANARAFLLTVLATGPMPAAIVAELGRARKFNTRQLWVAKQQIGAGSFKMKGKWTGAWFWMLSQHTPEQATAPKPDDRHTRRLRNRLRDLSKMLGYRLQPISKHPRGKNTRSA